MAWAKLRPSNAIALLLMSGLLLLNLRSGYYLKFDGALLPETKQRVEKAGVIAAHQIKTVLAQTATGCINQKPFTVEQYAQVRELLKTGTAIAEIEAIIGAGCGIELDKFSWTATNGKKLIVQFEPDGKLKSYTFDKREILTDV
ncbi:MULTISPECIES: hypothetical protein [Kamptonema]|uniref:hypothetical protein n=1 Tax=Kamptonema TaxID=1501433 RepID=UPI0001DAC8D6|nr:MULTISPECIES: hypothetical protein [Kamptonema]CBN59153.1 hypothetical protein OSCI_4040003 [Kamptonema sp. PCC 6506]